MNAFDQILEELKQEYAQNPHILALLITGSVAGREAKEGNDVDILLVTNGEKIVKEYRKGESLIEIGTVVLPDALEKIEQSPMQIYLYLDAKAIFDNGNYLAILQNKARIVLENYRPPSDEIKAVKKWLLSVVDKVTVAQRNNDQLKVGFHISNVLWKTVEGLYMVNSLPVPAATSALRRINSLQMLPENFEAIWEKTLLGNLEERTNNTIILMRFVLSRIDEASL